MKIGLIYPPSLFLDDPHSQPPLGLMYIAAALKSAGHEPVFHDWSSEANWRVRLSEIKEPIVGAYCVYPHFNFIKRLHTELRKMGVKLIVGGPDPSGHGGDYLDRSDMVIQGEGERAIIDAVVTIGELYKPMIIHRENMDIDSIPWPLREFEGFDIRNFKQEFHGKLLTTAMFSRGCYSRCKFCNSKSIWGRSVRRRNPYDCSKEVRFLKEQYGFERHFPEDDSFNSDNVWVEKFCDDIRNDNLIWRCLTRARDLTPEILEKMHKTGCRRVSIGVESGSPKILRNICKGETVEQQLRGIKLAKEAGIEVQAFIILGLPGEDRDTLIETKAFIEESRPDYFDLTLLRVFPDSDIWNERDKLDIEILDYDPESTWYKGGIPQSHVRTKALSKEDLEAAYVEMYDFIKSLGIGHNVGHYIETDKYRQIKSSLE